ncbi:Plasmid stabilization system protein [Planctomycetes bacterium MalM25]|nr:Plasmid stabilization system protein [Planctomycetes bacterium MalM25]
MMASYEVVITDLAERDIEAAFVWWRDNRSADQAERWLDSIYPAFASLSEMPERCSRIEESHLYQGDLRQLAFGLGKRPSHRIIIGIREGVVEVLRIRHGSQRRLTVDDL